MQVNEQGEKVTAVISGSHGVAPSRGQGLLHEPDLALGGDTRGTQMARFDPEVSEPGDQGTDLQGLGVLGGHQSEALEIVPGGAGDAGSLADLGHAHRARSSATQTLRGNAGDGIIFRGRRRREPVADDAKWEVLITLKSQHVAQMSNVIVGEPAAASRRAVRLDEPLGLEIADLGG